MGTELGCLSDLGVLNLCSNSLSCFIPQGVFMSSYEGNPYLWGCPLSRNRSWSEFVSYPSISSINAEEHNGEVVVLDHSETIIWCGFWSCGAIYCARKKVGSDVL